jgi:mannose-6-phosphate isomerase-like protein (cupin superfamily)
VSTGPEVSSDHRRIQEQQDAQGFVQARTVLTSRDALATTLMNALPAEGLAPGFDGLLIPIVFRSGIELNVLTSADTTTGLHYHDTDGFHQILNGTMRVSVPDQDLEVDLGPGNWVFIPAGVRYTLEVGPERCESYYIHGIPPIPPIPPR